MTSVPIYDTLKTARAHKFRFTDDEIALWADFLRSLLRTDRHWRTTLDSSLKWFFPLAGDDQSP